MKSFRILHLVDCYLPQTMNWLHEMFQGSSDVCEHLVHADHLICQSDSHVQILGTHGIRPYPLPFQDKLKRVLLHKHEEKRLRRIVKEQKPDVIHVHFGHVAIRYLDVLMEVDIPCCVSLYGFDYEYLPFARPRTLDQYVQLARKGVCFTAEGSYSKKLLMHYGIAEEQIFVLHLLSAFPQKATIGKFSQAIRCIQAASFTEKKNQLGFIEALHKRHAGRFVIQLVGEASDKSYFREVQTAVSKKKEQDIHIMEVMPYGQYMEFIAQSHFAIQFSKRAKNQDTEGGCPVFIKDALMTGRPVCTTRHCDIPDTIVHGFNGFLVDEDSQEQISETLDVMMKLSAKDYHKLAMQAGQSTRIHVGNHLSCVELLQIYKTLTGI